MRFTQSISAALTALFLAAPEATFAGAHAPGADTVVATVNGTEITLGHMIVLKQRLPQQYQQLPGDVLFDGILDQLVQQTMLGETNAELSLGSQLSLENEERALRASEVIQEIAEGAVSEEALEAAYLARFGEITPEMEFNASHILVETEEAAVALIEQLNEGADFAELARENSTGPSGPNGGQLGWFGKGAMVPEFEEAVVALDVASVSAAPVQTQFGWHVIRLNETRVKEAPTLDQVRGELMEEVRREAIEARIAELMDGAEVTRMSPEEIDPALLNDLSILE